MLSDGEQNDLCEMLDRLTPGLLPRDVFHAIARLMVTATFVVVPLVQRGDQTFVLLGERSPDDLYYPAMLNTPGTVIRASDQSLGATYERLIASELVGVPIKDGPIFVDNDYDLIIRGREVSLIHWIELDDVIVPSFLYDVEALPSHVVPTDRPRIAMAAAHFRAWKRAPSRGCAAF